MIVTGTPTANNVAVMAELAGAAQGDAHAYRSGENKQMLSACISFQYALTPVLLTLSILVFVGVAGVHS